MACPNFKLGFGSTVLVSETDPTPVVLTATAAAKGAKTVTLTAPASETAALKVGEVLAFGANQIVKVASAATVTDAGVAVTTKAIPTALIGGETFSFKDMLLLAGLDSIGIDRTRAEHNVTTIDDDESEQFIPGLLNRQANLGDMKVLVGNAAQELVNSYHDEARQSCLVWRVVGINSMLFDFDGFTTGNLPINFAKDNPTMGSATVRITGNYATKNVTSST